MAEWKLKKPYSHIHLKHKLHSHLKLMKNVLWVTGLREASSLQKALRDLSLNIHFLDIFENYFKTFDQHICK